MKVRAIKRHGNALTIGKIYDVVSKRENDSEIAIEKDDGVMMWFNNPYKAYSSYLEPYKETEDELFREQLLNA